MNRCEALLDDRGCYILVIVVERDLSLRTRGLEFDIESGVYFYIGSAKGSGGVRARVFRHLFPKNKKFWHIDHLVEEEQSRIVGFFVVKSSPLVDCEAELSKIVMSHFTPVPGFGCTDKPEDYSHLFKCSSSIEECLTFLYSVLNERFVEPLWIQNI